MDPNSLSNHVAISVNRNDSSHVGFRGCNFLQAVPAPIIVTELFQIHAAPPDARPYASIVLTRSWTNRPAGTPSITSWLKATVKCRISLISTLPFTTQGFLLMDPNERAMLCIFLVGNIHPLAPSIALTVVTMTVPEFSFARNGFMNMRLHRNSRINWGAE